MSIPPPMPLIEAPEEARSEIDRIRVDTYLGMGFSNLISLFIIITTAATLQCARRHRHPDLGASGRGAAADRRRLHLCALRRRHHRHRPAGRAGARRVGRLCPRRGIGLADRARPQPLDAKAFYGAIAAATLVGVLINFVDLDPIKALFWSAVINGVVAVPLMVVIMLMAMQRRCDGAISPCRGRYGRWVGCPPPHGRCRRCNVSDLVIFN